MLAKAGILLGTSSASSVSPGGDVAAKRAAAMEQFSRRATEATQAAGVAQDSMLNTAAQIGSCTRSKNTTTTTMGPLYRPDWDRGERCENSGVLRQSLFRQEGRRKKARARSNMVQHDISRMASRQ